MDDCQFKDSCAFPNCFCVGQIIEDEETKTIKGADHYDEHETQARQPERFGDPQSISLMPQRYQAATL